jgi:hypothetical protein
MKEGMSKRPSMEAIMEALIKAILEGLPIAIPET